MAGVTEMVCDTVTWFTSIPELSILRQPRFPDTINAGEVDSLVLDYAPSAVATKTAVLEWKFASGLGKIDTLMQFTGRPTISPKQRFRDVHGVRFHSPM